MPKIRHDGVEGTADIPEAVVPFWTGKAGWHLVDEPASASAATAAAAPKTKRRASRSAKTRPASTQPAPASPAGDRDDVSGQDASATTNPEE